MAESGSVVTIPIQPPEGRGVGKRLKIKVKNGRRWPVIVLLCIGACSFLVCTVSFLPDYYARWAVLDSVMSRVKSGEYHKLNGASLTIRAGYDINKGHLLVRLEERGYRNDKKYDSPGTYTVADERICIRKFQNNPDDPPVCLQHHDNIITGITTAHGSRDLASLDLGRVLLTSFLDSVWELREPLEYERFPKDLVDAVIAAEDGDFEHHIGIDFKGIARAALVNIEKGEITQGGSTITQQTVKTFTGRTGRTYREKLYEAALAIQLELVYDKKTILSAYLNNVYMGHVGPFSLHGMVTAARILFGKDVDELSPGECALLAGMIKSPNILTPLYSKVKAATEAARVLRLMKQQGNLAENYLFDQEDNPSDEGIEGRSRLMSMSWVWQETERELKQNDLLFSVTGEQGVINTSIDQFLQYQAQVALDENLEKLESEKKRKVPLQGAISAVDPRDGSIRALVGGRDFLKSQFNRATMAQRPVGSLIKPFVYLAAMEADSGGKTITPETMVADTPMVVRTSKGPWRPVNYDRRYLGRISVEEALIRSRNVPAVRIGQQATLDKVIRTVERVGISDRIRRFPSLFLGACSSNVKRVASAYAVLAHDGYYVAPQILDQVTVAGSVVFARRPNPVPVIDLAESRTMTSMLRRVLVSGTAKSARTYELGDNVAGKTGTSSDMRDSWFAGYSPELAVAVWVGNDDNRPIGLTGSAAALPVWAGLMSRFDGIYRTEFPEIPSRNVEKNGAEELVVKVDATTVVREKSIAAPKEKTWTPEKRKVGRSENIAKIKLLLRNGKPLKAQEYRFFK